MKIKEIHRTANGAWSPASHQTAMFATATSAHQVDATFSTAASLEIFEFNPASGTQGSEPVCRGVATIGQRAYKLVWSPHTAVQGKTTHAGALVAGVENGIVIYSVDAILGGKEDIVIREAKDSHSGPVRALDVSTLLPNFLASGAGESEVLFWDLNIAGHSAPVGPKSYPLDEVSAVAWNRKIGYILASSLGNRCVLWDLRKNDAIIKLQDQNSRQIRYKAVDWNPEIATQLALASDDDHSPVVQIWDLRNASSAVKTLEGHNRGILSIAWCPHDSGILLSAGKDGCVYGWNVEEDAKSEVVFSLPASKGWPFEVSWSPRIPSIFALSSYENSVAFYSVMGGHDAAQETPLSPSKLSDSFPGMEGGTFQDHSKTTLTESIRKAPKWLRKPGAISFSLDGKVVKTATESGVFGLELSGLRPTGNDLAESSALLEQFLNYNQQREFCENKIQVSADGDRDEWRMIKTLFDEDQHQSLLNLLGFSPDEGANEQGKNLSDHRNGKIEPSPAEGGVGSFHITKGKGVEAAITNSLLLGNIEAAVEMCLVHGRDSEALFLSLSGCGPALPALYHKAREQYFASHGSSLSSLIYGIVKSDAQFLLENCNVMDWKEIIVLFANYFPHDHFKLLASQLGDRLESAQSSDAIVCHILSGNIEKTVHLWLTRKLVDSKAAEKSMQNAAEKLFVMCVGIHGNRPFEFGPNAVKLLTAYAEYLAEQGGAALALRLINRFPSNALAPLKQLLYTSLGPAAAAREANVRQPPMPNLGKISSIRSAERTNRFVSGQNAPVGGYSNGPTAGLAARKSLSDSLAGQPPVRAQSPSRFNPAYQVPSVPAPIYAPPPIVPPQSHTSNYQPQTYPGSYQPVGPPLPAVQPTPLSYPPPQPPTSVYQPGSFNPSPPYLPQAPGGISGPPPPQHGLYDPTVHSRAVEALPADCDRMTSFQHKKLSSGWNDPPPLPALAARRGSNASVAAPLPAGMMVMQPTLSSQYTNPIAPPPLYPANVPAYPPTADASSMGVQGYTGLSQPPLGGFVQPSVVFAQPPVNYSSSTAANETSFSAPSVTPPPPKAKQPIPAELTPLSDGLAAFLTQTQQSATACGDSHSVKKLEDVHKKLEILNDCLRGGKLSPATLTGLSHILSYIQAGDHASSVNLHAQLSSQSSFLEVGSFLPAIKVLIQLVQRYP